uniref:Immunoglobulin domain-containing protein n=1 Tax=Podarcis muralis TaxID=64176 RepID=A0A670HUA8_PODMU
MQLLLFLILLSPQVIYAEKGSSPELPCPGERGEVSWYLQQSGPTLLFSKRENGPVTRLPEAWDRLRVLQNYSLQFSNVTDSDHGRYWCSSVNYYDLVVTTGEWTSSFSRVRLFVTPWTRGRQALLSSTASRSLVKLMLVASRTLSNHLVLCRPLLLVPSIFPNIRVFSRESSLLMRWPKYWSLSFRICPSSEHSGLISFRMDRFDLLAVHGTLKSLLQHHNSKASILRRSAFFMVQLSLPYITTGKTIALTIRTFVGKVMSLLFKMLSRFVIACLPRSKHLLIP